MSSAGYFFLTCLINCLGSADHMDPELGDVLGSCVGGTLLVFRSTLHMKYIATLPIR
ncbi:hypothetical protein BDR03DRAFT_967859 [Suillus americanus]|nr:hypothetical protein BDR03DRAFT_967859 [Suillus americanus]